MSVKGFLRDLTTLTVIVGSIIFSGFTLYSYFTTHDTTLLYVGLVLIFVAVFGALARYVYIVDVVWALLKKWVGLQGKVLSNFTSAAPSSQPFHNIFEFFW